MYHKNTTDKPCYSFNKHGSNVYDIVVLENDLVATVGSDNTLFAWRTTGTRLFGTWKHT